MYSGYTGQGSMLTHLYRFEGLFQPKRARGAAATYYTNVSFKSAGESVTKEKLAAIMQNERGKFSRF